MRAGTPAGLARLIVASRGSGVRRQRLKLSRSYGVLEGTSASTPSLRFASTLMSRCSQWRTKREASPGTALSGGVFLIGRQSPPCGSGLSDDMDASGFGTFETCRLPQRMSGYRGRPGVSGAWLNRRNRPSFGHRPFLCAGQRFARKTVHGKRSCRTPRNPNATSARSGRCVASLSQYKLIVCREGDWLLPSVRLIW